MQMQSDYSSLKVERPKIFETTALGAAFMAGLGFGIFKNLQEIEQIWQKDAEFSPQMTTKNKKVRIEKWLKAVERA